MVKDLCDMFEVLSSKLGKLIAYQFPRAWRSPFFNLYMSMDQSATAVDPSDVRREQLDGEDMEYQCDECSRIFSGTSEALRVLCAVVSIGQAYGFGSTSRLPSVARPRSRTGACRSSPMTWSRGLTRRIWPSVVTTRLQDGIFIMRSTGATWVSGGTFLTVP